MTFSNSLNSSNTRSGALLAGEVVSGVSPLAALGSKTVPGGKRRISFGAADPAAMADISELEPAENTPVAAGATLTAGTAGF